MLDSRVRPDTSLTATPDQTVIPAEGPRTARIVRDRLRSRRADLMSLAAVAVIVAVGAQLPLLRTHLFYYYDDSAAVLMPGWYVIGENLRHGALPLLDVDTWMGGNWAGEGQFGVFNPLMMANAVLISLLPDIALAAVVVKTEFLVILGTGIFLLAREYGARRGAAAAVAVAMPFAGYTLYYDAASWTTGLIGFSLLPHLWWTARRFARGRLHPALPLVAGFLTLTAGSPYAALGLVVVFFGVSVERLANRDPRAVLRLGVVGLAVALGGAVAFLPLLGIQAVGWRGGPTRIFNSHFLAPNLGQLINFSAPSYVPWVTTFHPPTTPMTYLSWFVVPLLPWFAWSALARIRAWAGVLAAGTLNLLFILGPDHIWLFRWPARLIEYVYLPVCIVVALLLSAGLRTDHALRRGLTSAALIVAQAYLGWSDRPDYHHGGRDIKAAVVVAALLALVLAANAYRVRLLAPALITGTLVILSIQLHWYPRNGDVTAWQFPHDIATMRAGYADRRDGNTIELSDPYNVTPELQRPDGAWREILVGNVNQVAGLRSLNSYTGMGNLRYSQALCMEYHGGVCPEAYDRLFATDADTGRPLVDLLRVRSIVVENKIMAGHEITVAPPGWAITHRTEFATTLRRVAPLPYQPDGRVSWAAPSVTVTGDRVSGDRHEQVTYTGGGKLIVAALAWPGWHATVDGKSVPVRQGPAGLIEVDLPPSSGESTLQLWFWPAKLRLGIELMAAGLLLGAGYCVVHSAWSWRRRRSAADQTAADGPAESAVAERAAYTAATTVVP